MFRRPKKRPAVDLEGASPSKRPRLAGHAKGGLTDTVHGVIYQLNVLMLFLIRASRMGCPFQLATEWPTAEKFDDLVLMNELEKMAGGDGSQVLVKKKQIRFLQAKHKLNEKECITSSDLLNETDGDFSLHKYFTSFLKIKQKRDFKDYEMKRLVICANIGLAKELLKMKCFSETEDDHILKDVLSFNLPENNNKQPKLMKLDLKQFAKEKELKIVLKKTSDLKRLAKQLAQCLIDGKLGLRDDLFKKYHFALAEHVIDVENGSFKKEFRSNKEVEKFRNALEEAHEELWRQQKKTKFDLELFYFSRLNKISNSFGKSKITDQIIMELPDDEINDNQIDEFLEKLVFAVNQPNEVELESVIKQELEDNFKFLDGEAAFIKLQNKMLKWMKDKKGTFLTEELSWLNDITWDFELLLMFRGTVDRRKEIQKLAEDCQSFFNVDELSTELNKILKVTCKKQVFIFFRSTVNCPTSSRMKVFQALNRNESYTKDNSYVFTENSTMQDHPVLETFLNSKKTDLMVVEFESREAIVLENFLKELLETKIFKEEKKFILMTQVKISTSKIGKQIKTDKIEEWRDLRTNLLDLTAYSQEKFLENAFVTFQGRRLRLQKLFENLNDEFKINLKEVVDAEMIEKIFDKKVVKIGEKIENSVEDFYIPRKFQVCEKFVKIENNSTNCVNGASGQDGGDGRGSGKESGEKRKELKILIKEKDMVRQSDAFVLIAAEPGMGKSMVLTKLAMKMKEAEHNLWVFRVNLNDHAEQLFNLGLHGNLNQIDSKIVIEFFEEILNVKSTFEQRLFENRWHSQCKLAVLFDGFDEISPKYKETVTQLLEHVFNHNNKRFAKVWLTTRLHLRNELEDHFNTTSYSLQQFLELNQLKFLKKYFIHLYKDSQFIFTNVEKIKSFVKELRNRVSSSIRDEENEFLGIPLQAKMLAEVFQKTYEQFCESKQTVEEFFNSNSSGLDELKGGINKINLYQKFVQKKFTIFYEEKKKDDTFIIPVETSNEMFNAITERKHMELSFEILFPDDWENVKQNPELPEYVKKMEKKLTTEELSRVGIFQITDGKVSFTHRTYAEYFVALYLVEELVAIQIINYRDKFLSFMREHLYKYEHELICHFFDHLLVRRHNNEVSRKFLVDVLNDDIKEVERFVDQNDVINIADFGGRTALHLASSYDCFEIVKALLEKLSSEDCQSKVDWKDEFFCWSPLTYARKCGHLRVVDLLLEHADSSGLFEGDETVDTRYDHNKTLLHLAAEEDLFRLTQVLVENLGADLKATDDRGNYPVHLAVYWRRAKVAEYLLKKDTTTTRNVKDVTVKEIVIFNGDDKMQQVLRSVFPEEEWSSDDLFLFAAAAGDYDEVKRLLSDGLLNGRRADIKSKVLGWSAPHLAWKKDNKEIVTLLAVDLGTENIKQLISKHVKIDEKLYKKLNTSLNKFLSKFNVNKQG